MATAVRDLDFHHLPDGIDGLDGYDRLLVLVRLGRRPVGQAYLQVQEGRIPTQDLRQRIIESMTRPFWECWAADHVGYDRTNPPARSGLKCSVAICTRDRPDDLQHCLDGLMRLPDDGQEILVIDSASKDDQIRQVTALYPGVHYVREDIPGLDRARNRALREASHEIVAFIDDDAVPDPGWLRALMVHYVSESVMCVTGLTVPLELESPAQEAYERFCSFNRGYEWRLFHHRNWNIFGASKAGAGVNMSIRKSTLDWIGPFDEALDSGTPTYSGGDTEMLIRILANGYRIVYNPDAINWHRHRTSWGELRRTIYGYGVGSYACFTSQLVNHREIGGFYVGLLWFWSDQLPGIVKAILRLPGHLPLDLHLVELIGCIIGPWAYLKSRRKRHQLA
jgi:GT2 family glycosyltransferase